MKKLIYHFVPVILIFFCLEHLFVNIKYDYTTLYDDSADIYIKESLDPGNTEIKDKSAKIIFEGGVIQHLKFLSNVLTELKEAGLPSEGELVKSTEKLERVILLLRVEIIIYSFLIFLAFSTMIAVGFKTWYAAFMAKISYILSIFIFLPYFLSSIGIIAAGDYQFGVPLFLLYAIAILSIVYSLKTIKKYIPESEHTFHSLYMASIHNEEETTNVHSEKTEMSYFKIAVHFAIIIFVGMLLGNLIYIPLFSLQKHYKSEFGFLLLGSLVIITILYIKNYYSIGKDLNFSKFKNLLVSISFLQFRFLRNLLYLLFSITFIIVFFTGLFILLTINSNIMQDYFHLIDKTLNL